MIDNSVYNVKEDNCCGCGACAQKCPAKCITMRHNERGFLMPRVDTKQCVSCGQCRRVCPEICDVERLPALESFAAVDKDLKNLKRSTSGGVFGKLASKVLGRGGVVYGCAWSEDNTAEHIRVASIEELESIQQSKYVQSDTSRVFKAVKADLDEGREVLFSSTACQLAGLLTFLGKPCDKLITVEVACHGVPSPGLFKKYCNWLEKKNNSEITSFRFRSKEKHKKGEHYKLRVDFANGRRKYMFSWEDPYYGSFLQGRTLRETCYRCRYKTSERVGDFLLADYWGVEKEHPRFPALNGASAVVIMSDKGKALFDEIKDDLTLENTTFEQITKHNRSIVASARKSEGAPFKTFDIPDDELFRQLKPGFDAKRAVKNLVPEKLKYMIKRL